MNKQPGSADPRRETHDGSDVSRATGGAWFPAWLKTAGIYAACIATYLGVVTGAVAAWNELKGKAADSGDFALCGIVGLPLLAAVLFNLLPALRERRERRYRPGTDGRVTDDYFTTAPREDDRHGFFANGYDQCVTWAATASFPIIHLTGLSGSGKSSLLSACLRPRLAKGVDGAEVKLLVVRSDADPLSSMKDELRSMWQKKPADWDALLPLDALRRAAGRLGTNETLLVALDQFEAPFTLGATFPSRATTSVGSPTPPKPSPAVARMRDFFADFLANPPRDARLLLSYRWDHASLLDPLRLPARIDGQNHYSVAPFNFDRAASFIRSCPGLRVPDARMESVLREAALQEGGRVLMRPIVANLLGIILQRMAGHPTLWRQKSGLLRSYVLESVAGESIEDRVRILRALHTDFQTARPRAVQDLVDETGLRPEILTAHLETLGGAGLLRCVNAAEPDPKRRTWQVAHDFVATLVDRTVGGFHRSVWRTVRPRLAVGALALAIGVVLLWPWVEEKRAIARLSSVGVSWNAEKSKLRGSTDLG
ncbi:MAG: hypothetical protein V3T86_04370, partial [Planctomycetota bacterium]